MPRRPRLVVPDVPLHIIQRGNNKQACFFIDSDYLVYLDLLRRGAKSAKCMVHAYVLMSNHIHILATPQDERGPGNMMKAVGERYVRYLNERCGRSGTLWDGRYRSCLIHDETYLFVCHRYIELNPVRAGMVEHPSLYRWSSYRCNAHAETDLIITPHNLVTALANDTLARSHAYRQLFSGSEKEHELLQLRDATNSNYACGNIEFHEAMGQLLGRQVVRISSASRKSGHRPVERRD
jgi:putative transposase